MKPLYVSLALLTLGAPAPTCAQTDSAPPWAPATAPLVLKGVTIIDVRDGRRHPNQMVVVAGSRIQAVGPVGTARVPRGAHVVDSRKQYLIPGLWDMHVHVLDYPEIFYPLFIANGVTGIRDMGSNVPLDTLLWWRREIAAGRRIGPRPIVAGKYLEGVNDCSFCIRVGTPAQARGAVDSLKAAGADFIKTHDVGREVYLAIAAEAKRIGIAFGGHLAEGMSALEASDSGQRTFEHNSHLDGYCVGDSASVERCAPIAARLRRNRTWWVPTLALGGAMNPQILPPAIACKRAQYWPDSVLQQGVRIPNSGGQTRDVPPLPPDYHLEIARRSGMPILTGTDVAHLWPGVVPGFSLQDELTLLVQGGLTPLDALRAATINPAEALDAADSLGTIASGKVADLVLLDADPIKDIHNATKIRAVVANGRYFDRAMLDGLLAKAKRSEGCTR